MRRAVPGQPLLALRPKLPILDTSKETPHNMLRRLRAVGYDGDLEFGVAADGSVSGR